MEPRNKCYLCSNTARVTPISQMIDTTRYHCDYCGDYILDTLDYSGIEKPEDKFKIACVLNERRLKGFSGVALSDETKENDLVCGLPQISVKELLEQFPKKASEFLNRTLLNLNILSSRPFSAISLLWAKQVSLNLFTENKDGCERITIELKKQGLLTVTRQSDALEFMITAKGYEWIEQLEKSAIDSKQAFVAMWFGDSMNDLYEKGIKTAIEKAGYNPMRIDRKDFNGKICDEIIAEIKKSKFLIADFTDQRGGVYFEAGFAKGLGMPVIFTVKEEEDIKKLHFDTRQYNHILYEDAEDLHKQLYNRIRATINDSN